MHLKLAEQMGRRILEAIGDCRAPTVNYPCHRPRPEQLRLAIEEKRGYKVAASGTEKAGHGSAIKKTDVAKKRTAAKRPKSVRARYVDHA